MEQAGAALWLHPVVIHMAADCSREMNQELMQVAAECIAGRQSTERRRPAMDPAPAATTVTTHTHGTHRST